MYTNQITLSGTLTVSANGVRAYTPYGEVVWAGANIKTRKTIVGKDGNELSVFVTNKTLQTKNQDVAELLSDLAGQEVVVIGELVTKNFANKKKNEADKWVDVIIVTDMYPVDAQV